MSGRASPERWERIQALFHEVADLPPAGRRPFLEKRCADDPTLVDDVLALAEEDDRGGSVLDRGLGAVAGSVLEGNAGAPRDFGPYRLLERIGEGGMGVVYLAERADLDRRVAVKFLRDGWLSPARRQRFAIEQRTLARLDHPGIARLYDAGTLPDGTPWIVMEHVEGVPLTTWCAARALTIRRVVGIFRAVCEAVLHAHRHAIVHRDLKPSNILVTPEGGVKLLDFGIAKQIEGPADAETPTRTGLMPMTPAYAAPEQVTGGPVGVHTDIYALGVILYELLAGAPPFDLAGRTPGEVERVIREREPERPSAAARHASGGRGTRAASRAEWADLDVLCLTAMRKDLARRYASVESLIRDLDHFLRDEPLEARRDSTGYRVGKFLKRHWRVLSAAGAVLTVVVALTVFYTARLAAARNRAVAEVERTRRIQAFMTELFEGGDEAAAPSDSLRVVTLAARGVREARSLSSEPAVQAELYQTLGGIYRGLGDFDRADSLLADALALRRAHAGRDSADVARTLVAIGKLRADQSKLDEAERLVREGLGISRRLRPPDPAALARATTALGLVLEDRGSYDEAIETLTNAARLDSSAALPPAELSATLTELANCHFYAGHYDVSDSLNRRVLAMDLHLYGPRHPQVAGDLLNLGAIHKELGHYAEAEGDYRRALDIYRGWYGDDHYETAAALTMIARVLIAEDSTREADGMLHRALAIREKVYGPNHPIVASTVNEIGNLAYQEGRYDDAEAAFRRMERIYETAYHGRHYLIGLAIANLASVSLARKHYPEAERLFREALRRYAEVLEPDHMFIGVTRIKLGRTLMRDRRYAQAAQETRAGYAIVARQSSPSIGWLQNARRDLVADYEALGQPDSAARYRAELEAGEAKSASAAAK